MAAVLVFSPQCARCQEVIQFIRSTQELATLISYHDVTRQPIPPEYKKTITRVPTLITKQRAIIVGQQEITSWLASLIPSRIECCELGGMCGMTGLDGSTDDNCFTLDRFNQSLMPILTNDLKAKIERDPKAGNDYSPSVA